MKLSSPKGFTLLEIMLAVTIMSAAMAIAMASFAAVARAWQKGNSLSEDMSHGDFVMDQLVTSLRSTYYPDATGENATYGFWLEDDGEMDRVSWVKMGQSMTLGDNPDAQGAHRVMFSVEPVPGKKSDGAAVRLWRTFGQEEEFDWQEIEPSFLSDRIVGFNCRVSTNLTDEGWEWEDVWEDANTNRLPEVVELTLLLEPLEDGDPPFEMKRSVQIAVSHLSRQPAQSGNVANDAIRERLRQHQEEARRRGADQRRPTDLRDPRLNQGNFNGGGNFNRNNPYPSQPRPQPRSPNNG